MKKERNFCFTFWENDIHMWNNKLELSKHTNIKYMIMGKEICPETKNIHYQSYVIFKNPIVNCIKALKALGFSEKIHVEIKAKNATTVQGVEYCKKDGEFKEFGEAPVPQGRRSDLQKIKEIIEQGGGMEEIIDEASNYQSLRAGELLLKYREKPREINIDLKVFWLWGDRDWETLII